MNLVTILVVSLFAQCNTYQLPTPVNNPLCHSYSPRRLVFSTADKKCGHDLALPSLDFSSNQSSFDHFNKVDYFGNKSCLESFDEDNMACAGIPEEIKNNQYASERELLMDLEQLGLDDLRIILNQDGIPIWQEIPGDEHNFAIGDIIECFDEWKNGRLIKCRTKVNVYVNDSFNRPKNVKRCPKAPEAPYVGFYVFWYKIRSDFAMGNLHQE
jgi:hypothetical protein